MPDVLVLGGSMHGAPMGDVATMIRERLPNREVAVGHTPAQQRELIADAEIVVGGQFDTELLDYARNLRLFACTWAGVGHVDLNPFASNDVAVTTASGVHGPNIAEHVLGWFLMITRRLDEGIRRQERREWRHFRAAGEFTNSRVCIVGLGAIGQTIADRVDGFDVETVGVRYTPEKGGPTDDVYGFEEITEALIGAEYVVVASPLTETTEGLIGADEFVAMTHDAVFANVGRGPIVQTDALVSAIRSNQIGAACLDVTDPEPLPADHPLWSFGNVYITPHNSGHTPHYWKRLVDILVENIERVEATGMWDDLTNQAV